MSATVASLNQLQADYQVFYQNLRAYHWKVKGPMFFQLHPKFESLYREAEERVDEIAERTLAIGGEPITTMSRSLELARFTEDSGELDAKSMVRAVAENLIELNNWAREAAADAEHEGDITTFNLLVGIADKQENEAWHLRAFLDS